MRFVLVHGAFHGAWCWERVRAELTDRGHDAVAIDLPGHGDRRDELVHSVTEYRDAVLGALRGGDVVVAHSFGGVAASMAAEAEPDQIAHLVYVAAFAPTPGGQFDVRADVVDVGSDEHGRLFVQSVEGAIQMFYDDCSRDDAVSAFGRLCPEPIVPLAEVPRFHERAPASSYVVCTFDGIIRPDYQRAMAAGIGVEPIMIDTAHSPFLNRPADLVDRLLAAAR